MGSAIRQEWGLPIAPAVKAEDVPLSFHLLKVDWPECDEALEWKGT